MLYKLVDSLQCSSHKRNHHHFSHNTLSGGIHNPSLLFSHSTNSSVIRGTPHTYTNVASLSSPTASRRSSLVILLPRNGISPPLQLIIPSSLFSARPAPVRYNCSPPLTRPLENISAMRSRNNILAGSRPSAGPGSRREYRNRTSKSFPSSSSAMALSMLTRGLIPTPPATRTTRLIFSFFSLAAAVRWVAGGGQTKDPPTRTCRSRPSSDAGGSCQSQAAGGFPGDFCTASSR